MGPVEVVMRQEFSNDKSKTPACRICGSDKCVDLGIYTPYSDYSCDVFSCDSCGCRFVERDSHAHEHLHSSSSSYNSHIEKATRTVEYYRSGRSSDLRRYLSNTLKNAFVIDQISDNTKTGNLLEIGCSRGYLTSYFLMAGYSVLGVDAAVSAIDQAVKLFGNHFCLPGDKRIEDHCPYDAIYHVGTVGCVESPIEMTNDLLSLLKPGGILVFNAPNVNAVIEKDELWVTTSPPDLVTLFPPGFWEARFGSSHDVSVQIVEERGMDALKIFLNKLLGRSHARMSEKALFDSSVTEERTTLAIRAPSAIKAMLRRLLDLVAWHRLCPRYSAEGGVHVMIRKR